MVFQSQLPGSEANYNRGLGGSAGSYKAGDSRMKLVSWCEDKDQRDSMGFSVYLESDSGVGHILYLDVDHYAGYLPSGGHWALMRREDVAFSLAGTDPECEFRSFLASNDPYWREAVNRKPQQV